MFSIKKTLKGLFFLKTKRHGRGYSLIELGVALGIVTSLIVAVVFLAQTVTTQNRMNQLNNTISHAVTTLLRIKKFDGKLGDQGSDLIAILRETGEFPDGAFFTVAGSGGVYVLKLPFPHSRAGIKVVNEGRFAFNFSRLPIEACFSIVQNILLGRDLLYALHINQGVTIENDGTVNKPGPAIDVATDTSGNIVGKCKKDGEIVAIYN